MRKDLILQEENYEESMRKVVEPYLESFSEQLFWEREKGKAICCVRCLVEEPRGVVVISHGYTESAEKYKEIIYYFAKEGYHVYMAEHCGHGKSYRLTEDPSLVHVDSYRRYVDDFLFVAEKAAQENPGLALFLYGHSMGGGIGAAAAARAPRLFRKVILTSPMVRPLTGGIPWGIARASVGIVCLLGRAAAYGNGHPYAGEERLEDSASLSKARFDYYQEKRKKQKELQVCAASFGWIRAAGELDHYLFREGVKRIEAPILLFQAGRESLVSEEAQNRFVKALQDRKIPVETVRIENAKHEIFNAQTPVLEEYWERVFDFFES